MGLFGLGDFVVCDRRKKSVCPRVEGPRDGVPACIWELLQ